MTIVRAVLLTGFLLLSSLGGLSACSGPSWDWEASADDEVLVVRSDLPFQRVDVDRMDGVRLATRRLPAEVSQLRWSLGLPAEGELTVTLHSRYGIQRGTLQARPPKTKLRVSVEAPLGQERRRVGPNSVVPYPAVEGAPTPLGLQIEATEAGPIDVDFCGELHQLEAQATGELLLVTRSRPNSSDPCPVLVKTPLGELRFLLQEDLLALEDARASVTVERVIFPANARGNPDPGREPGRVKLPSPALEELLRVSPLGVRARAVESPWGHQAIHVSNRSETGLNTLVRATVVDAAGQPVPAFRSRVRRYDSADGAISVLLRVPPMSEAVATVPLFVEATSLPGGASEWTRRIELIPLGSEAPLLVDESPLYVSRASSWAAGGFVAVLLSMLLGLILLVLRIGPWLRQAATSDLVVMALFAGLMFLFSAATHVVGLTVTSVLGPFAILVTGLIDDVFRYALLATLVTLLPRPGVVTLTLLVHVVMRTLALGGFHPALPLVLGSTVLWLEACLWLAGITRGDGSWRDESEGRRWRRLALGFVPPAVINGAVGLITAAVLYRLYYADWYVALMLLLPGLLYTLLACRLALGFAASLRKVQA